MLSTGPWWLMRRSNKNGAQAAREGKRGTALSPARPAPTPHRRLFGQATPGPSPSLGPLPSGAPCLGYRGSQENQKSLLTHKEDSLWTGHVDLAQASATPS